VEIYQIETVLGEKILVNYLSSDESQDLLKQESWVRMPHQFPNIKLYKNIQGNILDASFEGNRSVLFNNESDYYIVDELPKRIILLQSIDLSRLIYFQLISESQKMEILKGHTHKKIEEFSKKNSFDIYQLDDGKVLLSLHYDEGEIYNSLDEYIEIRIKEGDPFFGVFVLSK
jgi:hypothetical protein